MFLIDKAVLRFLVLLALTLSLHAQAIERCASRTVTVNVRDRQGDFVGGLSSSSFHANVRGQRIEVSSVSTGTMPRIVIVLDPTGSMTTSEKAKWEVAKLALESVITSISARSHLALVLPSDNPAESLEFGDASDTLIRKVRQLGDGNDTVPSRQPRTTLADSFTQILSRLGAPLPGDAIYVLSAGNRAMGPADTDKVERVLLDGGVRFYALYLSLFHDHYLERNEANPTPRMLARLADDTGGKLVNLNWLPPGQVNSKLEASLHDTYDQMAQFYSLVLGGLPSSDKNQTWSFVIVDSRGEERKNLKAMYPRKLPVCEVVNPAKEDARK